MAVASFDLPTHAPTRPTPASSVAESYLRFTQAGWSYLLPARALMAVVSAQHIRPLRQRTPGWAGTLAVRGGAVPVLDAADLLGTGGDPTGVLLIRLPSGPLGFAVERLEGMDPLPYSGLLPVSGVLGVTGGVADARDIPLALSLEHLDALRQIAVVPGADEGNHAPALSWLSPGEHRASEVDVPREVLRIGDPVVVLGDRWASDESVNLALPLKAVRVVARIGLLRPVPPSGPGIVGLGAWGPRALPMLSLSGLSLAAASPARPELAIVLNSGIAILANTVRGAQGLTTLHSVPPSYQPFLCALGESTGLRTEVRLSAGVVNAGLSSPVGGDTVRFAVLSAEGIRASLGE